jgi:hypothetical protein
MFTYKWMSSRTLVVSCRLDKKNLYIPIPLALMKKLPEAMTCRITRVDRNRFKIEFTKRFP